MMARPTLRDFDLNGVEKSLALGNFKTLGGSNLQPELKPTMLKLAEFQPWACGPKWWAKSQS